MTLQQLLLVLHIVFMSIWLGGGFATIMVGLALRAAGDAPAFARYCGALAKLGGPMFGGSAILTLLTGIALVANVDYWEFSTTWVTIGMVGWLVSILIGALMVGPAWGRVGKAMSTEPSFESAGGLVSRAVTISAIDLAIRVAIVVVMVWKPT